MSKAIWGRRFGFGSVWIGSNEFGLVRNGAEESLKSKVGGWSLKSKVWGREPRVWKCRKNSADGCRWLQRHDHGNPNKFQMDAAHVSLFIKRMLVEIGPDRSRWVETGRDGSECNSTYVE